MASTGNNGAPPRMTFLGFLISKGDALLKNLSDRPPCEECGAFHESDGPCPLVRGGALRAHYDELEAIHARKIENGARPSAITYPGLRGQIDGRSDSPTYKIDVELSRVARELEAIARGLAVKPTSDRIRELSGAAKKAVADLEKIVGRLR